jgi:Na+/phosphate symporter
MIEISEILYRWSKNLKIKAICKSLGYARNSVRKIIKEAKDHGLKQNHQAEEIDSIVTLMQAKKEMNTALNQVSSSAIFTSLNAYDERIAAWLLEKSMTITQIGDHLKSRASIKKLFKN